jgi:Zn-dependent M28 family amino/carboxypeptidase
MKPYILLLTLILGAGPWYPETGRAQGAFDPEIAGVISYVADSTMRQSIEGLQNFDTRYTFDSNRDSVARWVRERFLAAGLTDVVMDTLSSGSDLVNVVGTKYGSSDSEIVVGAHYDSYSSNLVVAPGADDNASGVSAVIEMARVVSTIGYTPASTIRFISYTGEEQGLWGSAAYAQKAKDAGRHIRAVLNFDMIGYRDVAQGDMDVYLVWYVGAEAESLAALTTNVIRQYTTLNPVLYTPSRTRSDSWSFAVNGYPAVFWLGGDNYPFYHTPYDLLEYQDLPYASEIARSALALLLTLDKSTADVHPIAETLPAAVRLDQNYPNPFNPSTTIAYTVGGVGLQASGFRDVRLVVHDVLGREVALLVNERKAPGRYEVEFDASGLASGIYFYRLTAGKFVETRKMVLLK